ncbi:MAG: hypothetical protein A3A98_03540 [Candidatus Staskawiczbacteria bacterium RIFCSPLOWO2_01_FULL_40_39]|uniref:CDP-diacylglycerol--glycerol-3-phosphate 3-phosphatidyltransferase n=1 Tax=Candidatus Staskawiczbacteria bacterium RIFCSPHIGHO2_01_FULL_39_25 TaxID=1802202 RepID=A0A1G2HQT6_9BACT|nr:MAG: hypothetical protein A2730_02810 [Candidatus Staskawiczbacteria bacterium RIFCSPHIGHO2_01_FULL_39_25]OGZ72885.1 MAG: hypothetical protein A3A98_03540 [Candidatus Staskawiczbacteria bacterium RIFCSPLOWO2_01_FULL_40_39]
MATLIYKEFFNDLKSSLEEVNEKKDQFLSLLIKPYWPRSITPNHLTYARAAIGIFLFILLFNFKNTNGFLIIPFFFLGALTDLLDGSIARSLNMETKLGEIIDPIADRVLIFPVAVYSLIGENKWLLFFLLIAEILNSLISLLAQGKKIFFGSNIFGKTKMFLQSVVFAAILLFWPKSPNAFFIYLLWISMVCILISIMVKIFQIKLYHANKKNSPDYYI